MPTTVLAERVGWSGSPSWFRQNVAASRPDYARLIRPTGSYITRAIRSSAIGRCPTPEMIPSKTTADLLAGIWSLLSTQLGAAPRRLIWDNETGIGKRNKLTTGVGQFCGAFATNIHRLKAYEPESKGGVARISQHLETSFLPGRDFESPSRCQHPNGCLVAQSELAHRPGFEGPAGRSAQSRHYGDVGVAAVGATGRVQVPDPATRELLPPGCPGTTSGYWRTWQITGRGCLRG